MLLAFTLFSTSFLAATILPFSSEAALIAALHEGLLPTTALLAASSGNVAAIIFNYALGYFLYEKMHTKLHASKTGKKAYRLGHRYGYYAMLLSWLPIIGDPLTIVAGVVRLNFWYFLLIAGSLRVLRYYLIIINF
ncbi:probable membrane protein YPO3302 [hydrothermal vent metagenome]|uniref:Probable membrane protein YPO3302 n=1 Tax=hydrothermal vent metagenome TaxID=652676 RepID=A0A1W1C1Q7_9ZZZZ